MNFQEKAAKLRKERGWSQTELGQRVGVHISHLSRLENGKSQPSVELPGKIAHAFGVSMDCLTDEQAGEFIPASVKDKPLAERMDFSISSSRRTARRSFTSSTRCS